MSCPKKRSIRAVAKRTTDELIREVNELDDAYSALWDERFEMHSLLMKIFPVHPLEPETIEEPWSAYWERRISYNRVNAKLQEMAKFDETNLQLADALTEREMLIFQRDFFKRKYEACMEVYDDTVRHFGGKK